jgi:hypothetical protein
LRDNPSKLLLKLLFNSSFVFIALLIIGNNILEYETQSLIIRVSFRALIALIIGTIITYFEIMSATNHK